MNIFWLTALIPSWTSSALIAMGALFFLIAMFIGKIPFISTYNIPIKIGSSILVICGLYLAGALAYKTATDAAVAELKARLAEAEVKAANVNTQIVTEYVTQEKVIKEKGDDVIQYVDREVIKYDNSCKIPKQVIDAHNLAATLNNAAKGPDGGKK
jgi:hypothetical protein